MTTKKIIAVIATVAVIAGVLIALFVGAIVGVAFYSIAKSDAATQAKSFLQRNEKLRQDIGDVEDFGSFITGNINSSNADGEANLHLKVIGSKRTVNATVSLMYQENRAWRVTGASYVNAEGRTVDLLDWYETGSP